MKKKKLSAKKRTASYIAMTKLMGGKILGMINQKQSNPYYISKNAVKKLKKKYPKATAFTFTKPGGSSTSYSINRFLKS